jgi:hypothetical protein
MIASEITILQFSGIWQQPANDQRSYLHECTGHPQLYSETLCYRRVHNAPNSKPSEMLCCQCTRTRGRVGHLAKGHQLERQLQQDRGEANSKNIFWHKRNTY